MGFISKVTIKKRSFTVHEGEKVHIECQADAVFISGRLDFHWTLNGIPINPTRNSRIQAIYKRKGSTTFVSSLRIVDFKENDGGMIYQYIFLTVLSIRYLHLLFIKYSLFIFYRFLCNAVKREKQSVNA